MAWDVDEQEERARQAREALRRRGYYLDMEDRQTEKEPSRCTRCRGAQFIEAAAAKRFGVSGLEDANVIKTPWPVAVCRRCGFREEL